MSRHTAMIIVAYNWDELGRNRIERVAFKSGGWVYYLGGPAEGQKPYDMLKPLVNTIGGFSLTQLETNLNSPSGVVLNIGQI